MTIVKKMFLFFLLVICSIIIVYHVHQKNKMNIVGKITPVTEHPEVVKRMAPQNWPSNHPVSIENLSYVELPYWGYDNKPHRGVLIVNRDVAPDVLDIFTALFKHQFPIEKMRPMYEYNNDDEVAMEDNNTSAFNCRAITGNPNVFSQHAYGRAVDINTFVNPYIKGTIILPKGGAPYIDRDQKAKGMITPNSLPYQLFLQKGWEWGGDWTDRKDYQHFQKPGPLKSFVE